MRVQLARMEGKLDLSNLRHDQTDAWKLTVDQRLHRHGSDISNIQTRFHVQDGQKQGLQLSGRIVSWLTGGGVVAIIAALMRHFGV